MTGGILALLAIGMALQIGVARMINFAHTAFYMLAAYVIYSLAVVYGLNLCLSAAISVMVTLVIGVVFYWLGIRPIKEHARSLLVMTVAIALMIQESIVLIIGSDYVSTPSFLPGYITLFGVRILRQTLLTFGISLGILLLVWMFITRTKTGKTIRATAQDAEMASLLGVNVERVNLTVMVISLALAAIAGIIIAPLLLIDETMWERILLSLMAINVIGGLGNIKGSIIGAFILGYVETMVVFLMPMGAYLRGAFAMAVMLIVLTVKPEGLFGIRVE